MSTPGKIKYLLVYRATADGFRFLSLNAMVFRGVCGCVS